MKAVLLACAGISGLMLPAYASAVIIPSTTTFSFSGLCSDCTGLGTATLVLKGYTPYAPGQTPTTFDASNFVSLTYNSNLISFTLYNTTQYNYPAYANGSIGTLPGFYPVSIGGVDQDANDFDSFTSRSDGTWTVTKNQLTFDVGTLGTWNVGPLATPSVPEPASWVMLILGMGAVGYALRRRPSVRVSYAA